MGYWSETIYGNDGAMDFLSDINDLFKKGYSPLDIIITLTEEHTYGDDELLVLADFELFCFGKIFYTSNVIDVLDKQLEHADDWSDPPTRKEELLKFKKKILDNKDSKDINRTTEEVGNWIYYI